MVDADRPDGSTDVAVRPLRRDAAENRDRLLRAASEVFGEQGTDASVELVARTAGVGMGTLYRRFPTKDALISELVKRLLERSLQVAEREATTSDGLGFERWLSDNATMQASNRGILARLWVEDGLTQPVKQATMAHVGELLAVAKAHGRIRADVGASDIALVMYALRGVLETTSTPETAAYQRVMALLLAAMRPEGVEIGAPEWTPVGDSRFRDLIGAIEATERPA